MNRTLKDLKVSEIMKREVVTVTENVTVGELRDLFEKYDFNAFPVVRSGILVGMVTKLDLLKTLTTGRSPTIRGVMNLWAEKVKEIMHRAVVTVKPTDDIMTVADYMVEFRLRSIPVVEEKRLVGIISRSDLMPHVIEEN
ncbi:MAG: Inosine-5'-monophosphate dehydrogenase [Methanomassiliicoccales archaeon PtaU1.Bin124]|nr:MAG: Inosine-5'-monophosphate dehydrogenase [Methanomassiliicoccales archaeon PtaU1.Bin124]